MRIPFQPGVKWPALTGISIFSNDNKRIMKFKGPDPEPILRGGKMGGSTTVQSTESILQTSRASGPFKQAVRSHASGDSASSGEHIRFNPGAPPVKVLRVILKLLESIPDTAIEQVTVNAMSGCSNFSGEAVVEPGDLRVKFNWDCAWRAREEGMMDHWNEPDQMKAAREFGYQCFESFEIQS
jgi:hypothetical protein